MKKITLVAMALLCSVAFTDCAAKKPVKKAEPAVQQESDTQRQIRELKEQQELQRIKQEMYRDSIKAAREMEKDIRGYDNDLNSTELVENTFIHTPCLDESIDTDEYMAGLGISSPKTTESLAMRTAREAALADIAGRYIGVIKNGVRDFVKETNTRNDEVISEGDLDGAATSVGEKAINKLAKVACRRITKTKKGGYICYMAVHVSIDEVADEIARSMEVNQVMRDKEKFLDFMEKELTKQATKQEAAELKKQKILENQELLESNKE